MTWAALVAVAALASPVTASADTPPPATPSQLAHALFEAGSALVRARRYDEACAKFEESCAAELNVCPTERAPSRAR